MVEGQAVADETSTGNVRIWPLHLHPPSQLTPTLTNKQLFPLNNHSSLILIICIELEKNIKYNSISFYLLYSYISRYRVIVNMCVYNMWKWIYLEVSITQLIPDIQGRRVGGATALDICFNLAFLLCKFTLFELSILKSHRGLFYFS